jgi:hypothetical protein
LKKNIFAGELVQQFRHDHTTASQTCPGFDHIFERKIILNIGLSGFLFRH